MSLRKIPYKWLVAAAFVTGIFMDLMDATVVNVALPTLADYFGTTNTALEWVVNAYLLSLAIWIPASGWIGDKFGTKKTFLFAILMFTAGSTLCGFAWSVESIIFFRVLQGIGGGMMTPVGTAMLFRAFPPEERAKASSVLAFPIALAPGVGPLLGGWLVDYVGWQWIFFINVPIGIGAFLFGLKFLKEHTEENAGSFDLAGFLMSGVGLVLLLYALSESPVQGLLNPLVLGSGILGAIILSALVLVEQKTASPLLHFRLYTERLFRTTNIILFFSFAAILGFLFLVTLFLQQLMGVSPFEAGLTTFPQPLGFLTVSTFASQIYPKLGPKKMVSMGLTLQLVATLVFLLIPLDANLWLIRLLMYARGFGMGLATIALQAAAFTNISSEETGRASALYNTNRQVASSFGVALLGTILFAMIGTQANAGPGDLLGYRVAFGGEILLIVTAIFFALRIQDRDAAASMVEGHAQAVPAE